MGSGLLDTTFQSLKTVRNDLPEKALQIVAEVQDEIIKYNTEKQLMLGIDNQGRKLSPKYSRVRYARAKNSRNPLPGLGTPDLNLTGSFHSNFYLVMKGNEFSFLSSDEKADKLTAKYGNSIFGLTEENEELVNLELIYPKLIEWILSQVKV